MPTNKPDQIEDEALAWLMRTTSGNFTQQQELTNWLNQSTQHRLAFENAQQLWQGLGGLREHPLISKNRVQAKKHHSNHRVFLSRMSLAMVACLALIAVLFNINPAWHAEYHTAVGEQQSISLADASTVYLNSGSAIDPDYSPEQRRIKLVAGEAEFVVSKDKSRPFIVVADGQEIKALGTDFIVKIQPQGISVTVIESSVQVSQPDLNTIIPVVLYPGQRIDSITGQSPSPISTVELSRANSWRFNRLIFESETLDNVIAEINRYRKGHIFLGRRSLANYRVSGVFNISELDKLLTVINKTLPVKSIALGERYRVLY